MRNIRRRMQIATLGFWWWPGISRITNRLHRRATARSERWLRERGFDGYRARLAPDALWQDADDLRRLYDDVRRYRPQNVLELGSGQSTVMLARALAENGSGALHSVDDSAQWLDHARALLTPEQAARVRFHVCTVEVTDAYGTRAARYLGYPALVYDYVLIDGPDLDGMGLDASCDLLDLWFRGQLSAGAHARIDGRIGTVLHTRATLRRSVRIHYPIDSDSPTVTFPGLRPAPPRIDPMTTTHVRTRRRARLSVTS